VGREFPPVDRWTCDAGYEKAEFYFEESDQSIPIPSFDLVPLWHLVERVRMLTATPDPFKFTRHHRVGEVILVGLAGKAVCCGGAGVVCRCSARIAHCME
jgi:hypothetical protein